MNIYTALCKIHLLSYQEFYIPVPCLATPALLFPWCWGGCEEPLTLPSAPTSRSELAVFKLASVKLPNLLH